jgi:hypothetical protein
MKKYTHAWLAFQAVRRLESASMTKSLGDVGGRLTEWFGTHRDDVIQGAWYPDAVIKDMGSSHVRKFAPATSGLDEFRVLPSSSLIYSYGKQSSLFRAPYDVERKTNLPERCDALAHSIIDNMKMQAVENKGSPVSPTGNHVAHILFMLSHYIADAHMPFHCDQRPFSDGPNLHAQIEEAWEQEVKTYYSIDAANNRFFYDPQGYPLFHDDGTYDASILSAVEDELAQRKFLITWGQGNDHTGHFMHAVCQYSYLLAYEFVPVGTNIDGLSLAGCSNLPGQAIDFRDLSVAALSDAIDAIARVWLRVWRKYLKWTG